MFSVMIPKNVSRFTGEIFVNSPVWFACADWGSSVLRRPDMLVFTGGLVRLHVRVFRNGPYLC